MPADSSICVHTGTPIRAIPARCLTGRFFLTGFAQGPFTVPGRSNMRRATLTFAEHAESIIGRGSLAHIRSRSGCVVGQPEAVQKRACGKCERTLLIIDNQKMPQTGHDGVGHQEALSLLALVRLLHAKCVPFHGNEDRRSEVVAPWPSPLRPVVLPRPPDPAA